MLKVTTASYESSSRISTLPMVPLKILKNFQGKCFEHNSLYSIIKKEIVAIKKSIKRKLISLCTGEIVASFMFILALISFNNYTPLNIDEIILYPFSVLIFILLQGSYYWFYRFKMITGRRINKNRFINIYRALKIIDLILLVLYPAVIIYKFAYDNFAFTTGSIFMGIFIYIFGIAEYINYYYIRLSYGKVKDIVALIKLKNLKKSSLNKELYK